MLLFLYEFIIIYLFIIINYVENCGKSCELFYITEFFFLFFLDKCTNVDRKWNRTVLETNVFFTLFEVLLVRVIMTLAHLHCYTDTPLDFFLALKNSQIKAARNEQGPDGPTSSQWLFCNSIKIQALNGS